MRYVLLKRDLSNKDSVPEEVEWFNDKASAQSFLQTLIREKRGISNRNNISGTFIEWTQPNPKSIKVYISPQ